MFVLILGPVAGGLCDLVEPVMGHSPLLWTATSLSYINFILQFLSVSLLHTHTCTRTRMILKETCDSDSDCDFTYDSKQAQDLPGSPHYCFVGGVKFPQGEGSSVIHCTAIQTHDFSTLFSIIFLTCAKMV